MKRPGASARSRPWRRCRSSPSPPTPCQVTRQKPGRPAATLRPQSRSARASSWPRSANSCRKSNASPQRTLGISRGTQRVNENDIGTAIVGAAMRVHSALGPGLLESAYETCLLYELEKQGVSGRRKVPIAIRYEALTIDNGYRVDLLIGDLVVVELKAVEAVLPVHRTQLLSYLRLGGFKLGYLLNFHVAHMRDGIVRMVNGL